VADRRCPLCAAVPRCSFCRYGARFLRCPACGLHFAATAAGWQGWGIEPHAHPDAWTHAECSHRIVADFAHLPSGRRFAAVTAPNVLDQVEAPWQLLAQMHAALAPGGVLLPRLPNFPLHRLLHRLGTLIAALFGPRVGGRLFDLAIAHEFGLPRPLLLRLLSERGFAEIRFLPSAPSPAGGYGRSGSAIARRLLAAGGKLLHRLTRGWLLLTPSILVVARKKESLCASCI